LSSERIDPRLLNIFNQPAPSSAESSTSHGIAASINNDASQELLKELPAIGPVTYLTELEVLIADVERDGFDYLVEHPEVHALSDAELSHDHPEPMEVDEHSQETSRAIIRGDSTLYNDHEGKGVTVAVMDTGVFRQHECFGGRVAEQISCVSGSYDQGDVHGHGTHVAGSIGGESIGVANEVDLLDLRVFGYSGGASTSSILQALNVCIQRKVDIVNMSLGSTWASRVLDQAVDTTVQNGVIACVAAGNSGPYRQTINSPASAQHALAVGATGARGHVASFSSRGPNPWYSWQKPDAATFGVNVLSASHRGGLCLMSGTSMATPGLAGALACVLEHQKENPGAKSYAEHLARVGGEALGQAREDVGGGFVTLETLERYVNSESGATVLAKQKNRHTSPNFFKQSVLPCGACKQPRVLHKIVQRTDQSIRLSLSCPDHRETNKDGTPAYDEVVLEKWKHTRISNKQYINALRRCGSCKKTGLVPIETTPLELDKKFAPHTKVKVGCLYCNGKGARSIPSNLSVDWMDKA
jgi:subtilisin family serine protease